MPEPRSGAHLPAPVPAGSEGGPQVGAVPAAAWLAADASGAVDHRPPDGTGRVRLRPRGGADPLGRGGGRRPAGSDGYAVTARKGRTA
ncbi:DUF4429 domain-containing protein [Streptomyces althioticus]|uniref:DUF4429 domain-containing protein n=1 Tax=Streptomyces althioticus TaxID=83380 RepID=UPI00367867EB